MAEHNSGKRKGGNHAGNNSGGVGSSKKRIQKTPLKSFTPKPRDKKVRTIFVLDTNILMHDATALYRFQEHNVYISEQVIDELDKNKRPVRGREDASRNARQANRYLRDIVVGKSFPELKAGIDIESPLEHMDSKKPTGKLFIQTDRIDVASKKETFGLDLTHPDKRIIWTCLHLQKQYQNQNDVEIVFVTKDINAHIQALKCGITVEDYQNDRVDDDIDLLHSGVHELTSKFWDSQSDKLRCWQDGDYSYYELRHPKFKSVYVNEFLCIGDLYLMITAKEGNKITARTIIDCKSGYHTVWGQNARNNEQNCMLNLLLDPEIHFVTVAGVSGTGKTILTLAAGLQQAVEDQIYQRPIIVGRETISAGEDIGFLPGTEEEKIAPWMGAMQDNMEQLTQSTNFTKEEKDTTNHYTENYLSMKSIGLMRGRSFTEKYVIFDECQNITPKLMKTLITRAGKGTKIICIGNLGQIDNPYLTAASSGFAYVISKFREWEHSGHITLKEGERSPLAEFSEEVL